MKQIFLLLCCLLCSVFGLTGCSANEEPSATTYVYVYARLNNADAFVEPLNNPGSFDLIRSNASYVTTFPIFDDQGILRYITVAFFRRASDVWVGQLYIDGSEVGLTPGLPVAFGNNAILPFEDSFINEDNEEIAKINAQINFTNTNAPSNLTLDLSECVLTSKESNVSVSEDGSP